VPRLINRRPGRGAALTLAALPFLVLIAAYLFASGARLAKNPDDKLLPAPSSFAQAMQTMALEEDQRSGDVLFWKDTFASLTRLAQGVGIAAVFGLSLGLAIGLFPYAGATFTTFLAVVSMIPPLAVLPILFITLGLGEAAKVALIVIGIAPFITRDLAFRAREIPDELLLKAQTLGANSWQIVTRVALPLLLPRLVSAIRLALGPAWLFLIAAEAIAATEGLGYRIFLVRRFLAMDVILPYVAWITLLAFALDWLLGVLSARLFAWAERS
jgi:NitT/TauT family transport system permease protein